MFFATLRPLVNGKSINISRLRVSAALKTRVNSQLSILLDFREIIKRVQFYLVRAIFIIALKRITLWCLVIIKTIAGVAPVVGEFGVFVSVELVVLISVISQLNILENAIQLREVVVGAIRQTFVSHVAELLHFVVFDVSIQIQNNGEERNRHEEETDSSQKPAKPHMRGQVVLWVDQLGEIIIVLQVRFKRRHSRMRVLTAANVSPLKEVINKFKRFSKTYHLKL